MIRLERDGEEEFVNAEDKETLRRLRMMNPSEDDLLVHSSSMQPAKLVNCDCTELKENGDEETGKRGEKTPANSVVDVNSMYNMYLVQNENPNNSFPTVFVITPTYFR